MPSHPRHSLFVVATLAAIDTIAILLAACFAVYMVRPAETAVPFAEFYAAHLGSLAAFFVAWPIVATDNHLFISRRRDDLLTVLFDVTKCVALSVIFMGFVMAFYTRRGAEPAFLSYFGLSAVAAISTLRIILQLALWSARSHGLNERQVLIIGANARARHLVNVVMNNPHYGYRLVGVLEDEPARCRVFEEHPLPCLGDFEALAPILIKHVIDEVYICLPVRSRYETIQFMAQLCEGMGVGVRLIADLFPLRLATSRVMKIEDIPILALSTVPENQPQLILQRVTDIVVSATALLLLSPVFLMTAIAIKLETRGPVFFRQERVGLNRRRFKMAKFRSMVADAEARRKEVEALNEADGPIFKAANDPRLTCVGRFIRKYSIDELPQLFNVLMGHMSLVGPRPPLPHEVALYSWRERRRLSVKPGMTGLSQVSGRSDLSFDDTVDLDLYYIDRWSIGLVFRILVMTVPAVLKGRGAV